MKKEQKLSKEYIESLKKKKCWICGQRLLFDCTHYYSIRGVHDICFVCREILRAVSQGKEEYVESFYGNEKSEKYIDASHHIKHDGKV